MEVGFEGLKGFFGRVVFCRNSPEVFLGKGILKFAANLQENPHAKV